MTTEKTTEKINVKGLGFITKEEFEEEYNKGKIVKCWICGEWVEIGEELEYIDGKYWCRDCVNENFYYCERCGCLVRDIDGVEVNVRTVHGVIVQEIWCDQCADYHAARCHDCDQYFSDDFNLEEAGSDGHLVCPNCLEENYYRCDDCGSWFLSQEGEWTNDCTWLCDSCAEERREEEGKRIIHPYHKYNYDINFLGGGDREAVLHMGVELEIDGGGESDHKAAEIIAAGGYKPNIDIICMEDGSLRDGFEMISMPATLEYHANEYGWFAMMERAKDLGYKSHDAGTCGLHVHIDRQFFGGARVDLEKAFSVILVNNAEWLKKFSRRNDFHYCEFPEEDLAKKITLARVDDDCAGVINQIAALRRYFRGHYVALNFANRETIEIRFNRGTLNFKTFIAVLQLVEMMAAAALLDNPEKIMNVDLKWFEDLAEKRGYKEFIAYADDRGIRAQRG